MKIPRLRVRQMIFLVVYAALMGCAHESSLPGNSHPILPSPVVTYPSGTPGHVWIEASVVTEPTYQLAEVWIEAGGSDTERRVTSSHISNRDREKLLKNTHMKTGAYVLVPRSAVMRD